MLLLSPNGRTVMIGRLRSGALDGRTIPSSVTAATCAHFVYETTILASGMSYYAWRILIQSGPVHSIPGHLGVAIGNRETADITSLTGSRVTTGVWDEHW